jgi:hypothetical protein
LRRLATFAFAFAAFCLLMLVVSESNCSYEHYKALDYEEQLYRSKKMCEQKSDSILLLDMLVTELECTL